MPDHCRLCSALVEASRDAAVSPLRPSAGVKTRGSRRQAGAAGLLRWDAALRPRRETPAQGGPPAARQRSCFGANSRGCLQGKLSGVTRDGKSRACAAHNVEKSLVLLRDDGRVPGTHLWANDSIIEVRYHDPFCARLCPSFSANLRFCTGRPFRRHGFAGATAPSLQVVSKMHATLQAFCVRYCHRWSPPRRPGGSASSWPSAPRPAVQRRPSVVRLAGSGGSKRGNCGYSDLNPLLSELCQGSKAPDQQAVSGSRSIARATSTRSTTQVRYRYVAAVK